MALKNEHGCPRDVTLHSTGKIMYDTQTTIFPEVVLKNERHVTEDQ